jgi:hypothetical protein
MYVPAGTAAELAATIMRLEIEDGDVAAIMIGERNRPDLDILISRLAGEGIEFFGGIFPGIIHGSQSYEEGAVVSVLPALRKPVLIQGLDSEPVTVPDLSERITDHAIGKPTAMTLVDGLTANIALFLQEMYNHLGDTVSYIGGGAGSLSLQQEPCVFTRDGLFQDAAVIVFLDLECHLGVRHGWEKIMGPVVATRTRKNVVCELNWRNAFEVYRQTVEEDSGAQLAPESFFDIAKGYPFGMIKEEMEDIVRDPIAVNDRGELICVGEVPENTALSILKGHGASLIRAAAQAADDCLEGRGDGLRQGLLVDCISRAIFLEESFHQELEAVSQRIQAVDPGHIPLGILTLGEISSYGEGFLEFLNKTIVVGALYEHAG